ncbi:MAG: PP0621 family protein [Betaproteobacteria bacterium]
MGKVIAWLVLIFVVLLALRIINQRKARKRQGAASGAAATEIAPMVRCVQCGVFLPRTEADKAAGGYTCPAGQCVKR